MLGSEQFEQRERAQQRLLEAGQAALDFLEAKGSIADPEVRIRVEAICRVLAGGNMNQQGKMVKLAARSLLQKPNDPATGGHYYEWFGQSAKDCSKGYRQLAYTGPKGGKMMVEQGKLRMFGKMEGDNDLRLLLKAKDWPVAEAMPDEFQVSCLAGGGHGAAGTWHVALCVGNVKAIFHPGYRGGGFRFEKVGTRKNLSSNLNMGFTPAPNALHRIELHVTALPQGKVSFKAVVTAPDGKRFETSTVLSENEVGSLDRIGLERSGHAGGEAIFDDLMVKLVG